MVTILVASPGAGLDRREVGGCHYGHAAAAADRAGPRPERRRSEPETPGLVDFMTVQVSASSTMLQGSSATRRSVSKPARSRHPEAGTHRRLCPSCLRQAARALRGAEDRGEGAFEHEGELVLAGVLMHGSGPSAPAHVEVGVDGSTCRTADVHMLRSRTYRRSRITSTTPPQTVTQRRAAGFPPRGCGAGVEAAPVANAPIEGPDGDGRGAATT